jgi:hypothetical protein
MKNSYLVSLSSHIYRLLLYLYPASFRREFGREMHLAFGDYSKMVARRDGLPGLVQLWLTTFIDLAATAFVERLKEMTNMSQNPITRLCGAAGMLGGLYLIISGLTGLTETYTIFSIPSYLVPFYALGLTACVIGMFLVADTLTPGAKFGLGITFLGTAVLSLGLILMSWFNVDEGWVLWRSGHLIHTIGLLVFGLAVQNLSLRWRVVPALFSGVSILLFAIAVSTNSFYAAVTWDLVQGICWLVIGSMLVSGIKSPPRPNPVVGV